MGDFVLPYIKPTLVHNPGISFVFPGFDLNFDTLSWINVFKLYYVIIVFYLNIIKLKMDEIFQPKQLSFNWEKSIGYIGI